jgi:hypothetical protein
MNTSMRSRWSERARRDGVPRLEPSSVAESEPSDTPDDGYAGDAVGGPEEGARVVRQGTADSGNRPAPLAEGDSEEGVGVVAEVEMSLGHGGEAEAGGEMRMRRQRDGGDGGRSPVVATVMEEDDPEPRRRLSGNKRCMVSGAKV